MQIPFFLSKRLVERTLINLKTTMYYLEYENTINGRENIADVKQTYSNNDAWIINESEPPYQNRYSELPQTIPQEEYTQLNRNTPVSECFNCNFFILLYVKAK